MVFSSHLFLFYFLPLTLLLYYVMPTRSRHLVLTILSYVFYGWANPLFVVLMFSTTIIDYVSGLVIADVLGPGRNESEPLLKGGPRTRAQKGAVIVSVCANLALLGFFKYFNFATDSFDSLVAAIGWPELRLDLALRITLPLGISFYTFQSMSYTIDVYRGDARVLRRFIDFACYVSVFPQLVAGPIIRFQEVADQLLSRTHTFEKFARGAAFISLGLTKKVLLANPCGKVADTVFAAAGVGFLDSWYGVVAYAFQIYFDFSAYSDMAIGLGLMIGFVFPKNFDSPYLSRSITEFWQRWHISLSTWLRDYLYIPLGGNRKGNARTYCNLALVMILGGLWHGAAWNYLVWGGIHGSMLAVERARGKKSFYDRLPPAIRIFLTFILVCVAWVFFRAENLTRALQYCKSLIGAGAPPSSSSLVSGIIYQPYYVMWMIVAAVIVWFGRQTWDFTRNLNGLKAALIFGLFVLSTVVLSTQAYNPFIYFIF
jgi:alginate O-acetyltransferase complex protein AlgI